MEFRTIKIWKSSYEKLRGISGKQIRSITSLIDEAINYLENKYKKK